MKKSIIFLFIVCAFQQINAQIKDSSDRTINQVLNAPKVKATNLPGALFPDFKIALDSDRRFKTGSIDKNDRVVFMMFNPSCGHCLDQTKLFIKHFNEFENTHFVLTTGDQMLSYLPEFLKNAEYVDNPKITIGCDLDFTTMNLFAYEGLPQIMVYGKDKKLIDVFYKDTPLDKIKSALERDGMTEGMIIKEVLKVAEKTIEKEKVTKKKKRFFNKK